MVVAIAIVVTGCGSGTTSRQLVVPNAVPLELVPPTLEGGLTVTEYQPGRNAFAQAGSDSLVADGRVWAIRRGETLVATLQISAVKNDVSVQDPDDRKAILQGVMTGTPYETIDVGDLKVAASTSADKNVYLWFGPKLFEVLQVKASKVDPDALAADVISFQQSTGKLAGS
jgi:hypothetical protein